jgi:hypothetical protein
MWASCLILRAFPQWSEINFFCLQTGHLVMEHFFQQFLSEEEGVELKRVVYVECSQSSESLQDN